MISLGVALSGKCNFSCSYCYFNKHKLSHNPISLDNFFSEYQNFRSTKCDDKKVKIDFFGGEPLLYWDMVKLITQELKNDGCSFFLPTNGSLLNSDMVNFINAHNINVSISFDGLWQNSNRLLPDKKETLQLILEKGDLITRINNFSIHTMIYKDCYNLLENHLYICNTFKVTPEMALIRDVGVWNEKNIIRLNQGISELVDWYILNANKSAMPGLLLHYLRDFIRAFNKNQSSTFCGAGESLFFYIEDKIVPCQLLREKKDIKKMPLYTNMAKCKSCKINRFCRRGCLFENIRNGGPVTELCSIYRHIYNEISRMVFSLKNNVRFRNIIQGELNN